MALVKKKKLEKKIGRERKREKQESEGKIVTETGRETNGKRQVARNTGTSALSSPMCYYVSVT